MKIGQYCQRQRCKHVELEQFLAGARVARVCQRSWAFLFAVISSFPRFAEVVYRPSSVFANVVAILSSVSLIALRGWYVNYVFYYHIRISTDGALNAVHLVSFSLRSTSCDKLYSVLVRSPCQR